MDFYPVGTELLSDQAHYEQIRVIKSRSEESRDK